MLPINRLCQIMGVSQRGYRAFCNRPISASQRKAMVVLAHIRDQFEQSLGSYGRPRMTEELKELGLDVGHPSPAGNCAANAERGVLVA